MAVKTKTKKQTTLLNERIPAPLVGPPTPAEWLDRVNTGIRAKPVTPEARRDYRQALELYPNLSKDYGDMARLCRGQFSMLYESQPIIEEQIKHRAKILRQELAGEAPTPLELLLIDVLIAAHQDYWHVSMLSLQSQKGGSTLRDMEKWERILSSKEQRYLRAVGELARVRRLLNLPAPQVNINMPGGQQVNVSGKP